MSFSKMFWAVFLALIAAAVLTWITQGVSGSIAEARKRAAIIKESQTPTPGIKEDQAADIFNNVPSFVTLTMEIEVAGANDALVKLPQGERLPVVAKNGGNLVVRYHDQQFSVPSGITKEAK